MGEKGINDLDRSSEKQEINSMPMQKGSYFTK
jgi:hypothetical protein